MKRYVRNINDTSLFVKLYLSHRRLWDTEDEEYRLKHKRTESYRDVIKKYHLLTNIKLDEYEVRTKIRSIRSTYALELNKIKSRAPFGYTTTLQWFDDFHKCMSDKNHHIKMSDIITEEELEAETNNSCLPQNWESQDREENTEEESSQYIESSMTNNDYALLIKTEPRTEPDDAQEKKFGSRKRKYQCRDTSTDDSRNESITYTDPLIDFEGPSDNENEFDMYGRYVASTLKSMGVKKALQVQVQIQNILSEARLESLGKGNET